MQRLIQLTLDLFDTAQPPAASSAASTTPAPAPTTEPTTQPTAAPKGDSPTPAPSPKLGRKLPPQAADDLAGHAHYAHPRANRQLVLSGCVVAYEFVRSRRRTIGFAVGPEGLQVRAPRWVPLTEVQAALLEKSAWVLRKLAQTREQAQRASAQRMDWREGARLNFLGQAVQLAVDPQPTDESVHAHHALSHTGTNPTSHRKQQRAPVSAVLHSIDSAATGTPRHVLRLGLPAQATPAQIQAAAQSWLMRQAQRVFTERLEHYAPQLGVHWTRLGLSDARTRWGSASADGAIRLNWRLIHLPLDIVDYVVVHELAHLRVMNHSRAFWAVVASVMPDHAQRRKALKTLAPALTI